MSTDPEQAMTEAINAARLSRGLHALAANAQLADAAERHALPLAVIRDGYLPVGPEFDVTAGGVTYRALRAFDRTGKRWIYYAPVPRWNEVTRIAL